MKKRKLVLFTSIAILTGCSDNEETVEKNKESQVTSAVPHEEKDEVISFSTVKEADDYFFDLVVDKAAFTDVEKILADEHYVSNQDFMNLINLTTEYDNLGDTTPYAGYRSVVEKNIVYRGGIWQAVHDEHPNSIDGSIDGYKAEYVREDDTYKLVSIEIQTMFD